MNNSHQNNGLQISKNRIIGLLFFLLIITFSGCDKKETIYPDNYDPDAVQTDPTGQPIQPSAPIYTETQDITEHVVTNTTLGDIHADPNRVDYRVTLPSWEIHATLTLESGVVIEFAKNASLDVQENGVLYCRNFDQSPIRLTSTEKTAGNWIGIIGHPGSRVILGYSIVEYAGGALLGQDPNAAAINTEGDFSFMNSTLKHSAGYGIRTSNSARLLYIIESQFTDIAKAAISTTADQIHAIGINEEFARNGHNGVLVRSSTLEDGPCPAPWETLTNDGSASYLIENEDPTIPAELLITTNLEIKPGVNFRFGEGASLRVKADVGRITAIGEAYKKITFQGKQAEKGFWKGIFLEQSRETSQLKYVTVKHGGSAAFDDQLLPVRGNIGVHAAKLNIYNSTIADSDGCAFATHQTQGENALIEESNNTFTNNEGGQFCGQ